MPSRPKLAPQAVKQAHLPTLRPFTVATFSRRGPDASVGRRAQTGRLHRRVARPEAASSRPAASTRHAEGHTPAGKPPSPPSAVIIMQQLAAPQHACEAVEGSSNHRPQVAAESLSRHMRSADSLKQRFGPRSRAENGRRGTPAAREWMAVSTGCRGRRSRQHGRRGGRGSFSHSERCYSVRTRKPSRRAHLRIDSVPSTTAGAPSSREPKTCPRTRGARGRQVWYIYDIYCTSK